MRNAAELLGERKHFIKIYHTPKALLRSVYERYFANYPDNLLSNIRHRFRVPSQFNVEELQYLLLEREGRIVMRRAYNDLLYLKPKRDESYIAEKLSEFTERANYKFGCFNSLDLMTDKGREMTIEWIKRRIGIK
jgi:hypothetical protein